MSSALNCPNCGASVKLGVSRCVKCGSTFAAAPQQMAAPAPVMWVPPLPQAVHWQQQNVPIVPKSKIAAALLAFFLGSFGIHNFYLGYNGKGLAQLLLTILTCGYGAIITWPWALIEFILLLTGGIACDSKGVPLT